MQGHRKIDLQSPADYTYLYANTVALSRQKLDLHLPPAAANDTDDAPDPMRERVRQLVDQYITKTFTTASPSININGLEHDDGNGNSNGNGGSSHFALPAPDKDGNLSFESLQQAPAETVEYEAYDTKLAERVTSLYAQLESLTTTVAQMRKNAPGKAAGLYREELERAIRGDEEGFDTDDGEDDGDVEMEGAAGSEAGSKRRKAVKPEWKIEMPLGTENEAQRWRSGDVAEAYDDALRAVLRLQGEVDDGESAAADGDGSALATTVGKAERAGRAVEVVEKM